MKDKVHLIMERTLHYTPCGKHIDCSTPTTITVLGTTCVACLKEYEKEGERIKQVVADRLRKLRFNPESYERAATCEAVLITEENLEIIKEWSGLQFTLKLGYMALKVYPVCAEEPFFYTQTVKSFKEDWGDPE